MVRDDLIEFIYVDMLPHMRCQLVVLLVFEGLRGGLMGTVPM
jgi:hypothetical protein